MSRPPGLPESEVRSVGLCTRCRHAQSRANARGSRFWQCTRADPELELPRYPRLPVLSCVGFEEDAETASSEG